MKLKVDDRVVAMPADGKINIERSSPYLNDDSGTFSFPFPVPTLPNQQILDFPGRLTRNGDLPSKLFVLEDKGIQVLRGEVDYDEITAEETGMVLKSGKTEFNAKTGEKKLWELNFGEEWWPAADQVYTGYNSLGILPKLAEWDTANITDNGKYVVSPFSISNINASPNVYSSTASVNWHYWTAMQPSKLTIYPEFAQVYPVYRVYYHAFGIFCLQFKVTFVINKIFEFSGYQIVENALASSEFSNAIIFSNILSVGYVPSATAGHATLSPAMDTLKYADLMPDITVNDFLDGIKSLFCLVYEINENKKQVRIKFQKDLFDAANLDGLNMPELQGWVHREEKLKTGLVLKYQKQDENLDTESEYEIKQTVATPPLPAPGDEEEIWHITSTNRDYVVVKNGDEDPQWKEIGRLKEAGTADLTDAETAEIKVIIPAQEENYITDYPSVKLERPQVHSIIRNAGYGITKVKFLAVTLYHGIKTFGNTTAPYASFDRYSLNGLIDVGKSLKPSYLLPLFSPVLEWKAYRARGFTKYVQLPLKDLVALQWGKRYMIGGVRIVLDKIRYDLPYEGMAEIEGWTA